MMMQRVGTCRLPRMQDKEHDVDLRRRMMNLVLLLRLACVDVSHLYALR